MSYVFAASFKVERALYYLNKIVEITLKNTWKYLIYGDDPKICYQNYNILHTSCFALEFTNLEYKHDNPMKFSRLSQILCQVINDTWDSTVSPQSYTQIQIMTMLVDSLQNFKKNEDKLECFLISETPYCKTS